jgi:hypothetical protein
MFKEQAFQDPGNARQQAARGTYDPAYLNYTLGKLMIRKLRADWIAKKRGVGAALADVAAVVATGPTPAPGAAPVVSTDDQALWHDFHDKFLSYRGPPIPLLRKEMMGKAGNLL